MRTALAHASLLVLSLAAVASTSRGDQPDAKPADEPRPAFTAFLDLKPLRFRRDDPILCPVLPPLSSDAPVLRKVRHAQAREGLLHLAHIGELMRTGSWNDAFLFDTVLLASEVYAVAAEAEDTFANRVPWYEERVRWFKGLERFFELRVTSGTPPAPAHPLRSLSPAASRT